MSKLSIFFPSEIHFSMRQLVRIHDVNYRKHLSHDRLVSMIHEARANFFESLGVSELMASSEGYVLADLQIVYLEEAFFGDELRFDIAVTEISKRSCQMVYQVGRMKDNNDELVVIARAKTGVVFYDYDLRQAIAVPDELAVLSVSDSPD